MIAIDKSKNVAMSALLATFAVLLGYVEFLIPVVPPVAGVKLGLGNIAVLLAMRMIKMKKTAVGIMLTKVIMCAVLFSGIGGLPYSLAGGVVSLAAMTPLCSIDELSSVGISAVGGAMHMAAQLVVASIVTSTLSVMSLLPLLLAVGTVTGMLNGIIVNLIEKNIGNYLLRKS